MQVMPIHNPPFIRGLLPKMGVGFPDCGKIQEYYGDAVGLYFAWMAFMRRWLVPPACMGAATFLIHQLTGAPPHQKNVKLHAEFSGHNSEKLDRRVQLLFYVWVPS